MASCRRYGGRGHVFSYVPVGSKRAALKTHQGLRAPARECAEGRSKTAGLMLCPAGLFFHLPCSGYEELKARSGGGICMGMLPMGNGIQNLTSTQPPVAHKPSPPAHGGGQPGYPQEPSRSLHSSLPLFLTPRQILFGVCLPYTFSTHFN